MTTGAPLSSEGIQARFAENLALGGPPWLEGLRKEALGRFFELGYPSTRLEEWRRTDVGRIARTAWEAGAPRPAGLTRESLEDRILPAFGCNLLVFVNGHLAPDLSAPTVLAGDLRAVGLASSLSDAPEPLEPRLARQASFEQASFVALNTACFVDGAWVQLGPERDPSRPLHLVYVSAPGPTPSISHPRTLVVAEPGSRAVVIEDHVTFGEGPCFSNAVTEVVLGEDASLDLVRLQREGPDVSHVGHVAVTQGRDSRFSFHSVVLGGRLVRNDVRVELAAPGADCLLSGLFLARGTQHVDNQTFIDHAAPHCTSRELYKGILDDDSRGVFQGRIRVRPDAQKTVAQQQNKNLLLSDRASVDSQPQLEIRADDVTCSHGSTTGSLEEDAFFYLRSRGLDEESSRGILRRAFAAEVIDAIPVEALRETLAEELLSRFTKGDPDR